jgi:23S rRNA (adenine2503-C2)-methyltransferase
MKSILNYTLQELKYWMKSNNHPEYRAKQVFEAIYTKAITDLNEIKVLPLELRTLLCSEFYISEINEYKQFISNDGTIKYYFKFIDSAEVETVLIPQNNSNAFTICLSTQFGCRLNCAFCATGKLGLRDNLKVSEIISQILFSESHSGKSINNIVIMGMGDPLDNYDNVIKSLKILIKDMSRFSKNRVTLSSSGFPDKIKQLADENLGIKFALSLHSTDQAKREQIMPSAKSWKIDQLIQALEYYYIRTKQDLTFEYIVFEGFNNKDEDINRLKKFCSHFPAKINLISFHNISFTGAKNEKLKSPGRAQMEIFANKLRNAGVNAFIRKSAGEDISAACGQLAFSEQDIKNDEVS